MQVESILSCHVLQVELVVVVAIVLVALFLMHIYAGDFAQGSTIGSGAATIPGSGGACTGSTSTGSGAVYDRGVLVDSGSSSGAVGSGHVGGKVKFLVMVKMVLQV